MIAQSNVRFRADGKDEVRTSAASVRELLTDDGTAIPVYDPRTEEYESFVDRLAKRPE